MRVGPEPLDDVNGRRRAASAVRLGRRLAAHRARAGLTQEEVAERAGMSVRGLRNIELGLVARPRRQTIRELVEVLAIGEPDAALLDRCVRSARATAVEAVSAPPAEVDSLPAAPPGFVGRTSLIDELSAALTGADRHRQTTALIVGAPGTGKTTLAVRVARLHRHRFPDGQREGLPLAVRVAGGRLAAHGYRSLEWFADRLSVGHHRLDELEVDDIGVRATLATSVADLSEPARRLLGRLGQLDIADMSPWIAAAVLDLAGPDAEAVLEELAAMRLVEPAAGQPGQPGMPRRFTMHDLVHMFARELGRASEPAGALAGSLRRVLATALCRTEEAARVSNRRILVHELPDAERRGAPPTDEIVGAGADTWFEYERPTLVTLVLQACDAGEIDHAYGLAYALLDFFDTLRYDDDLLVTHDRVFDAAGRTGHEIARAYAAYGRAIVNADRGRYSEVGGDMEFAHRTFAAHRATVPVAELNQQVLLVHQRLVTGRPDEARVLADDVVARAGRLGTLRTEAMAMHTAGALLAATGDPAAAVPMFERGLELFEKADVPVGVSLCRTRLGAAFAALGDHARADAELREALRLGVPQSRSHILLALAENALEEGAGTEDPPAPGPRCGLTAAPENDGRLPRQLERHQPVAHGLQPERRRLHGALSRRKLIFHASSTPVADSVCDIR